VVRRALAWSRLTRFSRRARISRQDGRSLRDAAGGERAGNGWESQVWTRGGRGCPSGPGARRAKQITTSIGRSSCGTCSGLGAGKARASEGHGCNSNRWKECRVVPIRERRAAAGAGPALLSAGGLSLSRWRVGPSLQLARRSVNAWPPLPAPMVRFL
jgi:hypothetical protein